jgi:hypothetical protein
VRLRNSIKNNNVNLFGCIQVVTSGACENVTMINCSGVTGVAGDNGRTFINGVGASKGRVLRNAWVTLNSSNASALSPYSMDGDNGNKYKVDTSSSSVYITLDPVELKDCEITLKVTDATNDILIYSNVSGTLFEFSAMPYTITGLTLGDSYTISSDGTDFYII